MIKQVTLQNVNLSNDFLFGKVMSDTEICRQLLERILGFRIRAVKILNRQKVIDNLWDSKGVRLDIYVEDDNNSIYNVEMQVQNKDIPKRSRYYLSSIDLDTIQEGDTYHKLKETYVIFICLFDLFGQGKYMYSFQNYCDQDKNLLLNDGTHRIFLNTKGRDNDIDEEIIELLKYIEVTTEETAKNCKSELVKAIHRRVESVRNDKESEVQFMTFNLKIKESVEEAKEEAKEETIIEMTVKMLKKGFSVEVISDVTGLSYEEIEEIKDNN